MSFNLEQRPGTGPALSGDAQLALVRRYARILRSAPAETARFHRVGTGRATVTPQPRGAGEPPPRRAASAPRSGA
jgi:hypothetical protein